MDVTEVSLCFLCRPYTRLVHTAKRHKETTLMEKRTSPSHNTHTYYTMLCPLKETSRPHIPQERTFQGKFGQSKKPLSCVNKGMFCRCNLNALLMLYHIWRLPHGWIQTNKRGGMRRAGERGKQFVCVCVYAFSKGGGWSGWWTGTMPEPDTSDDGISVLTADWKVNTSFSSVHLGPAR